MADAGASARLCTSICREELRFIWEESVELMYELTRMFLPCLRGLPDERLRRHCCVRWNPFWWLGLAGAVAFMLPGHAFHFFAGQGNQVREDESEVERVARIHWVYTYSGGFIYTLLWDATVFLLEIVRDYGFVSLDSMRSCLCALAISVWYLLGDVNLLFHMARKDLVMVHAAVISRIVFGISFLLAFLVGLSFQQGRAAMDHWSGHTTRLQDGLWISWFFRLLFSLFMVVSFRGYWPLLNHTYGGAGPGTKSGPWKLKVVVTMGVLFVLFAVATRSFVRAEVAYVAYSALVPVFVVAVACCMERSLRPSIKGLFAGFAAVLPFVGMTMAFIVCGTDLWLMLIGF